MSSFSKHGVPVLLEGCFGERNRLLIRQLLGVRGGTIDCYLTGRSLAAHVVAANTILITMGATGVYGPLLATICGEAVATGPRQSARVNSQVKTVIVHFLAVAPMHRRHTFGCGIFGKLKEVAVARGCERIYVLSTPEAAAMWTDPDKGFGLSTYNGGAGSSRGGELEFCPWSLSEITVLTDDLDWMPALLND